MDEELKQIAEDGFNSIILVVPWREFQPSVSPEQYNDYAWEKFDRVMEAAGKQDLKVMLRVGYTWDYYGSDNVLERYEKMLYDETVKQAWMHYTKRLYEKASAHEKLLRRLYYLGRFLEFCRKQCLLWKRAYWEEDGGQMRLYPVCKRSLHTGGTGGNV